MNPSFSVCVICRDGSRTMHRMMNSLDEFRRRGGQICVVDTGSRDRSENLARSYGADVTEVGDRFLHTVDAAKAAAINERFIKLRGKPLPSGMGRDSAATDAVAYSRFLLSF